MRPQLEIVAIQKGTGKDTDYVCIRVVYRPDWVRFVERDPGNLHFQFSLKLPSNTVYKILLMAGEIISNLSSVLQDLIAIDI